MAGILSHGFRDWEELLSKSEDPSLRRGMVGSVCCPAAAKPILFPQIRFLTNDAWPVVRGIVDNNAFPILLMNQYGKGKLFVLTVPDNFTDLYGCRRGR